MIRTNLERKVDHTYWFLEAICIEFSTLPTKTNVPRGSKFALPIYLSTLLRNTRINGYAETIRAGLYKDEKELQGNAKVLLQRSRYIDKLLDQLLDITRQEEGNLELHIEVYNVSEMMRKIAWTT